MTSGFLKVGELARRAGVSVRALHHYDEIGLLAPARGGGGRGDHRLYGAAELRRLLAIQSLKGLGLSLGEIRSFLADPVRSPLEAIELRLARVDEELELGRRLRDRLAAIAGHLRRSEEPTVDELLEGMRAMAELDEYFTDEQREALARRREALGEEGMRAAEREWTELFEGFRKAMRAGVDPGAEEVRGLARRANELIAAFSGGDAAIESNVARMYREKPRTPQRFGVEPELWAYLGRARAAVAGEGLNP